MKDVPPLASLDLHFVSGSRFVGLRDQPVSPKTPAWPTIKGMDAEQFHRISKALADPQRLAILERIAANREVACATLCEQFPVTQATISHHVKELVNAGLVTARRRAKFVFYQLEAKIWAAYLAEMQQRIPAGARRRR